MLVCRCGGALVLFFFACPLFDGTHVVVCLGFEQGRAVQALAALMTEEDWFADAIDHVMHALEHHNMDASTYVREERVVAAGGGWCCCEKKTRVCVCVIHR